MATVVTPTPESTPTRPAYLDGRPKRMLINGQWVEAASSKTFDTINPSTGETLASIAEGDAEDINRAVTAARRAFEGPWSKFKPYIGCLSRSNRTGSDAGHCALAGTPC